MKAVHKLTDSPPSRPGTTLLVSVFILLCLVWGTTWAVIQIGLKGIAPFTGVAIRFLIASVVLLVLAHLMGVKLGRGPREKRIWLVNGLLSFTVSYGIVYWAEQWVPSGLTAVLFAVYPLFVAIIGHFVLPAERLTIRRFCFILLSFVGIAIIFLDDFSVLGGVQVLLASAVMLISPLAAAIGSVVVKRWGSELHPFSVTAAPMMIAAAVMGMLALAFERGRPIVVDVPTMGSLFYLAIMGSALTFSLFYWLLLYLPANRLALIAYVTPVVAVSIGILRGEPLTTRILVGSAVVITGVALASHVRPLRNRP